MRTAGMSKYFFINFAYECFFVTETGQRLMRFRSWFEYIVLDYDARSILLNGFKLNIVSDYFFTQCLTTLYMISK